MTTYHQIYNEGRRRLMDAGFSDQNALLLMNETCSHYGINLYMEMENEINPAVQTDYLEAVHEMEKGRPLAYVLGYENFYGYDFEVNEDVLIPRPETEELAGLVLQLSDEFFPEKEQIDVFDVATGSGAIGITLSLEEPKMKVTASDISDRALKVAARNSEKLGASVRFLEGDMLEPFIEEDLHCDILVCNPPYIPDEEQMEKSVVEFEPHVALFGGHDGLKFYRQVLRRAGSVVRPGGLIAFEMGYDQGDRLSQLALNTFPDAEVIVHQDLNGKDRMLSVHLPAEAGPVKNTGQDQI